MTVAFQFKTDHCMVELKQIFEYSQMNSFERIFERKISIRIFGSTYINIVPVKHGMAIIVLNMLKRRK